MAEVLQENTPIYIRNYGSGGLATASFRGSNAYHTPVIWNGINIQNPMNGQIDFSAIPVFLSDEISLQYGGNGGVWGSGAMAGLLFINSAIAKIHRKCHHTGHKEKQQTNSIGHCHHWVYLATLGAFTLRIKNRSASTQLQYHHRA